MPASRYVSGEGERIGGAFGYGPSTRFASNTGPRFEGLIPEAYAPLRPRYSHLAER